MVNVFDVLKLGNAGQVIELIKDPNAAKTVGAVQGLLESPAGGELIKMLIALFKQWLESRPPATQPPVEQPPVVVLPPPTPTPLPPPYPPARPIESSLLCGLHTIYHNWFIHEDDQNRDDSTAEQTEEVRRGRSPLPPGARLRLSADPQPFGCIEFPFPTIVIAIKDLTTGEEIEDRLTPENPAGAAFSIQAPTGGDYIRSNGHFPIVTCPEPANRSSIRFRFEASNGAKSEDSWIPRCAPKGDRK